MERPGYQRFGLIANPFHDLASESVEEIALYHVPQEEDASFEALKQEVLEGQRKALAFVIGPVGAGKTQRLKLTEQQAAKVDAWAALQPLASDPKRPARALATAILKGVAKRRAKGPWTAPLSAASRGKPVPPEALGEAVAGGLNALAPAFLLLNDVDFLEGQSLNDFLQALTAAASHLKPGTMIAVTCNSREYQVLTARQPALATRVNRVFNINTMSTSEAKLVLAKRLAGGRIVEDLDPLYPFTDSAVAALNQTASGSPRRLLQVADIILEAAVRERRFSVDDAFVLQVMSGRTGDPEAMAPVAKPKSTAPAEAPLEFTAAPAKPVVTPRPAHPATLLNGAARNGAHTAAKSTRKPRPTGPAKNRNGIPSDAVAVRIAPAAVKPAVAPTASPSTPPAHPATAARASAPSGKVSDGTLRALFAKR